LPDSWEALRADQMVRRVRRPPRIEDGIVTAFRDGQVTLRTNRRTEGFTEALQEIGYQGVRVGDLVVHGMDAFAGAIGVSDSDGKASPVVHAYREKRGDARFVAYCLRAASRLGYIQALAKGIRERSTAFDSATFKYLRLPSPPLSDQRAIADFLDRETAKIDALIAKQNELVLLLQERRVAAVASAVNRGIRRDRELVDRGISWQGPVPNDWIVGPIRRALRLRKSLVGDDWAATPLLSLTKRGVIPRDPNSGEGKFPASFEGYQVVEPGNLVFCLFDMDETPRTVGLVRERGMLTSAYTRFDVNGAVASPEYLYWTFSAIDDGKRFRPMYSGLRKVVQKPRLLGAPLALPSLAEQRAIVEHLDREIKKIDALIAKAEEFISLAGERRAALITAAVTGQSDVMREAN